jgi:hypothetical protein
MNSDSPGPLDRHADDVSDATERGGTAEPFGTLGDGTLESRSSERDELSAAEAASGLLDVDVQNRLWLRALVPLLQLRSQETDPSGRVQFALDLMYIAACERIARILRSDLLPDRG